MTWWPMWMQEVGGLAMVVSWTFWVLFSIVLHELAHGWAALWQGDDTPRTHGRITWNPMVHMGPLSLLAFAVIGIAWGVMPTDPSKYRWRRKGRIVVSAAGPAMNLLLAFIALNALVLWEVFGAAQDPLATNLRTFFFCGALLNIVLAVFNLLPVPPLDGSGILSGLSLKWYIRAQNPMFQQVGFFALLLIFFSGVGVIFFEGAANFVHWYEGALVPLLT